MRIVIGAFLGFYATWFFALHARAEAQLHSYALLVGSNRGGEGQGELSFAERDAVRMGELLVELGRTPQQQVSLLRQPSVPQVKAALSALQGRLEAHAARGERTQLLFYYSGHARARALSLGREELPLDSLREALKAMPSTLTLVVLDACQSGAFSGVKGAQPAADFSISSVNELHSQGIAVLASSTAAELSQESSELGSSYFSHHLLVALRGAGDGNGDGRVSLDEAYGYAYQHTLSDTARTQVGSQHATLETDIRGRGDVPLSYPVDADAQLVLPRELVGRVLVQREQRGVVIAEIVKAEGMKLALALPAGSYDVVLHTTGAEEIRVCSLILARGASHALSPEQCKKVAPVRGAAKNAQAAADRRARYERWFLEMGIGLHVRRSDAYEETLNHFGFRGSAPFDFPFPEFSLGAALHRNLSLTLRWDLLADTYSHRYSVTGPTEGRDSHFSWTTHALSLGGRARLPLGGEWAVFYAEADLGLGMASSLLEANGSKLNEKYYAPVVRGALGFTFAMGKHFGTYVSIAYAHAAVLENELGQKRQDGGFTFATGLRVRSLKGKW